MWQVAARRASGGRARASWGQAQGGQSLALRIVHSSVACSAEGCCSSRVHLLSHRHRACSGGELHYLHFPAFHCSVQACERFRKEGGQFECLYDSSEVRDTDITNANVLNHLALNVTQYALDAVVTASLIGQSSAFVGGFSSNMARLGYELLFARSTVPPLAITLDRPWFMYP